MDSETTREARDIINRLETTHGFIDILLGTSCEDDYNPNQPNDYEKMIVRKGKIRKEMESRIEREKLLQVHIQSTKEADAY
jgi:splicing factor 45